MPSPFPRYLYIALAIVVLGVSAACLNPTPPAAPAEPSVAIKPSASSTKLPTATRSQTPTATRTKTPTELPLATEPSAPTLPFVGPTLSFDERMGTATALSQTRTSARATARAKALVSLIVPGGPQDVPGWETPVTYAVADPTHLVYTLDFPGIYDKVPDYYNGLMRDYGWQEQAGSGQRQGNSTILKYGKAARTATITVSLEADGRVKVAVEISL